MNPKPTIELASGLPAPPGASGQSGRKGPSRPETVEREGQASGEDRRRSDVGVRRDVRAFVIVVLVLIGCFARPLGRLATLSWHSEIYSYILLIPFVSIYLAWARKFDGVPPACRSWRLAMLPAAIGAMLVGVCWGALPAAAGEDVYLAIITLAFLCFVWAAALLVFGWPSLRQRLSPAAFLVFIVPFPSCVLNLLESFLQHRSAYVAECMFSLSGMPVLRTDTFLKLPGISLEVAPECSGIHSTLVLFLASLGAGYLFLNSPWRRGLLAAAVLPLALLRNGFRIFTVGQLCVQISPAMIDSYIHRRGGPIFFALSLIPLALFLLWLRRGELKTARRLEARTGSAPAVQSP